MCFKPCFFYIIHSGTETSRFPLICLTFLIPKAAFKAIIYRGIDNKTLAKENSFTWNGYLRVRVEASDDLSKCLCIFTTFLFIFIRHRIWEIWYGIQAAAKCIHRHMCTVGPTLRLQKHSRHFRNHTTFPGFQLELKIKHLDGSGQVRNPVLVKPGNWLLSRSTFIQTHRTRSWLWNTRLRLGSHRLLPVLL